MLTQSRVFLQIEAFYSSKVEIKEIYESQSGTAHQDQTMNNHFKNMK